MTYVRRGILFVVSSPSGAGKTTLAHRLAAKHGLEFSVSYTTRRPRPGEVHGKDYYFVSNEEFDRMIAGREFAEWAHVHGNRYGTSIATVNRSIEQGVDYLFDIDWQGGKQICQQWKSDSVLCFILPPSLAELERRLRSRNTDSVDVIERRLAIAKNELAHFSDYDYLVVNDDLDRALAELSSIYVAARCATSRNLARGQALLTEAHQLTDALGREAS